MLTVAENEIFVARERELARLDEYLEWALTGKGSAVFVTGEAGAGKTTLIREFIRRAQDKNDELLFAVGNCNSQTGAGDPYLPFREILSLLTGDVEAKLAQGAISATAAQRLRKFFQYSGEALIEFGPTLINTFVPGAGLVSRVGVFAADKLGWLDRLRNVSTTDPLDNAELTQEHIFEQFTAVLQAMAAKFPLVLWLDDLHWVDPGSASLLFHLGRALEKCRILVLGTYRAGDVALGQGAAAHPLADVVSEFKRYWGDIQIDLDQARASDGRRFVDALLDAQPNRLDETFRAALFQHTGGHPLFTIELLNDLQDRAELTRDDAGFWLAAPALDWRGLPARVEGIIEKRIGRLDADLLEILMTASVAGERFTLELVAQVQNRPARELVRLLSREADQRHRLVQALGSQRLGRQRLSFYQFRHNLIQKYLYQRLDEVERAYLHEEMGFALESFCADEPQMLEDQLEELTFHFYTAGVWEKALEYGQRAGKKARALYASQAAITWFTQALAAAAELGATPPRLLHERAEAYDILGDFDQARADYEAALTAAQAAGDHHLTWQILLDLGLLWASRDYQKTGDYSQEALDLARTMDDAAAVGHSLNRRGNWLMNSGHPKAALEHHREALTLFESLDDRPGRAATLDLLAMTSNMCGDLDGMANYYEQAITILRELNDRQTLSSSLANLAMVTLDAAAAQEAVDLARAIDFRAGEAYALGNLGFIACFRGQYAQGLRFAREGMAVATAIEHRQWQASINIVLGFLYLEQLAIDEAIQYLEAGRRIAQDTGAQFFITYAASLLAQAFILAGQLDRAAALLPQQPIEIVMAVDFMWYIPSMELALASGEPAGTVKLFDELDDQVQMDATWTMFYFISGFLAQRGRALLRLGQLDAAKTDLQAGIDLAQNAGVRSGLWKAYLTLSQVYQASGQPAAAAAARAQAQANIAELAALIDDELRDNFQRRALAMFAQE